MDVFLLIPTTFLVLVGLASIFINEEDLIGIQFLGYLSLMVLPMVGVIYNSM